jgi:hypothetical protein
MRYPCDFIEFLGTVYPTRSIEIRKPDDIVEIYRNRRSDGVIRVTDVDPVEFVD